jgi:hypothetical protein
MGGGLTLGLAPKHKLQKKATQKRDIQLACLLHMQAVELVILLLTFAVTFLLQEDFFLVGTSRA